MVKSATIKIEEAGAAEPPLESAAPAVVKAKAEAIKTLAGDRSAIRRDVYSNDNWRRRRKVIYGSLFFFGLLIAYLAFLAPDDELRRSLVLPVVGAYVSVVLGYAGFATMDDSNKRSTLATTDVPPEE